MFSLVNCLSFAQSTNDRVVCHKHLAKSPNPTFQGTGCNFHLTLTKQTVDNGAVGHPTSGVQLPFPSSAIMCSDS
jgi:hypothetical protein